MFRSHSLPESYIVLVHSLRESFLILTVFSLGKLFIYRSSRRVSISISGNFRQLQNAEK